MGNPVYLKPIFKIEANGSDVTAMLDKESTVVKFHDESGIVNDKMSITLADAVYRPKYGDKLRLWLGYEGHYLEYCGLFKVETTTRIDKKGLQISATGVEFEKVPKKKRNKAYKKISLNKLAHIIAARYGLKVKADYKDVILPYLGQTNESDLHLLQRLATEYNAIFAIKDNTLYFVDRKTYPKVAINADECISISIKHSAKTLYRSCVAKWHDPEKNKMEYVIVGSGEPKLIFEDSFRNKKEALQRAKYKLDAAIRGIVSGSLTHRGFLPLWAGQKIAIYNTYAYEDDYIVAIKSIEHTLSQQGWIMRLEFENAPEDSWWKSQI